MNRLVKEAESKVNVTLEEARSVRDTMDRVLAAWTSYKCWSSSLQVFLEQQMETEVMNKQVYESCVSHWSSLH